MQIPKVKPVVSRQGIQREIIKVRRELLRMKKTGVKEKDEAIIRQLLQLEALECILFDYHIG